MHLNFTYLDSSYLQPYLSWMTSIYIEPLKGQSTAADEKGCDFFPDFEKNMVLYCNQQKILMKYHALFVILEKAEKFETVVCCKS